MSFLRIRDLHVHNYFTFSIYADKNSNISNTNIPKFQVLLLEEAETYPIFSDADRNEFIFLIFKHICLGGQVCQVSQMRLIPYLIQACFSERTIRDNQLVCFTHSEKKQHRYNIKHFSQLRDIWRFELSLKIGNTIPECTYLNSTSP